MVFLALVRPPRSALAKEIDGLYPRPHAAPCGGGTPLRMTSPSWLFRSLCRALIVVLATLWVLVPVGSAARAIAGAIACSERASAGSMETELDEEESSETAALPSYPLSVRRATARRESRTNTALRVARGRCHGEMLAYLRERQKHQASPRAPPHRLLN